MKKRIGRQIMFTAAQYKWLQKRAEELECSIAEVLRRLLDDAREKNG